MSGEHSIYKEKIIITRNDSLYLCLVSDTRKPLANRLLLGTFIVGLKCVILYVEQSLSLSLLFKSPIP